MELEQPNVKTIKQTQNELSNSYLLQDYHPSLKQHHNCNTYNAYRTKPKVHKSRYK
jgi:hypothetical protein